jgi:menaquinone-dependent protoporphyrinogen IX oxidase
MIKMKALVVYGTRWGGTVGVAEKIREAIDESGLSEVTDMVEASNKEIDIGRYDLVIVGSGIRADKWTKSASTFLDRNADELRTKKTALFVSCQMADREEEAREVAKKKYLLSIADEYRLKPIAFGFFGGYVDFKKSHGIVVDVIVRVNRKKLLSRGLDIRKVHDTRDWKCIGKWATEVAETATRDEEKPR